jgi:hypothetical protein
MRARKTRAGGVPANIRLSKIGRMERLAGQADETGSGVERRGGRPDQPLSEQAYRFCWLAQIRHN